MDFTTIKAGEPIEVGHVVGFRFWRYQLRPLKLFSWVAHREWQPEEAFEADKEPMWSSTHGVHSYKTAKGLRGYADLEVLASSDFLRSIRVFDGVVGGTVKMWGVVIEHEMGYRAQYARPASFDEAHGEQADDALVRLRRMFEV